MNTSFAPPPLHLNNAPPFSRFSAHPIYGESHSDREVRRSKEVVDRINEDPDVHPVTKRAYREIHEGRQQDRLDAERQGSFISGVISEVPHVTLGTTIPIIGSLVGSAVKGAVHLAVDQPIKDTVYKTKRLLKGSADREINEERKRRKLDT
jgi:hypothetical protein